MRDREVDPQGIGPEGMRTGRELRGGSPGENAAVIRAVFSGREQGAKRDAILLNAAGAIAAGVHADDLRDGLELARVTIDSGRPQSGWKR